MPGYENIMGESLLRSLWEEVAQARGVTPPPPPPDWRSFIPKASPFNYARALPPASDWAQEMLRAMQAGEFAPKPTPPNWQYYKPPISGPPAVQSGGPGILQRGGMPAVRGAQSLSRMPIPQPTGGGMGSGPAQGFRSLTSGGVPQTINDIIEGVGYRIGEGRRALGSGIQQLGQGARALGGYAQEAAAPVMSGAAGMASGVAGSGLMGTLAATLPMLLAGGSSGPDELRYAPQYRQQVRAESPEQPPMGAMPVSGQGRSVGTPPPPAQPPVPPVGGSAPTPPPQDIPQEGVQWTNLGGPAWRARVHEYDDEQGLTDRGSATFQAPQGWAPGGGGVAFSEGPDNTAEYIKRVDKYVAEGEAQRHRAKMEQLMSAQQNDPYRKQVQEWIPEAVNTALRGGDHAMAASLANLGKSVLGSLDDKDAQKLQQQLLLKDMDQQNRVELQGMKSTGTPTGSPAKNPSWKTFHDTYNKVLEQTGDPQKATAAAHAARVSMDSDLAAKKAREVALVKGDPAVLKALQSSTDAVEAAKRRSGPLTGSQAAKFDLLQSSARQANLAASTYRPEYVGKGISSFTQGLSQDMDARHRADQEKYDLVPGAYAGNFRLFLGIAHPEEVQFRRAVRDIADMLLRARSGAQINEQEYQRLKAALFQETDEPGTFVPSLARFQQELHDMQLTLLNTSTKSAEELKQSIIKPVPIGGGAAQPPATPTTPSSSGTWSIKRRGM